MKHISLVAIFTSLLSFYSTHAAGPVECFKEAYKQTSISNKGLAIQLCAGAATIAPVSCYKEAYKQVAISNSSLAIQLCIGATSNEPVECFKEAYRLVAISNAADAIRLCAPQKTQQCAK